MQLNLTLSFFDEEKTLEFVQSGKNIYTAVKDELDAKKFIVKTEYENLDIIPSSSLMSSIEYELYPKKNREKTLSMCLKNIVKSQVYDYILIDCPPTLGGWVANVLFASDFVLIPVEASPWGLFGLANMFEFCQAQKNAGAKAEILGIAVTKADVRKTYFKQTMESLNESDVAYVFKNYIKLDSAIEWSQDNSKPVVAYKRYSRSSLEYIELTKEIMENANR
jgi:chromosome partitioning protein